MLELGCGGGRDAAAMLAAGFDIDATDGSPALVDKASRRLGRPARLLRFDQLAADQRYDAVWAAASLLHVPRAGLPGVLARVRRALRPGGWHHASFRTGEGETRDGYGRLFSGLGATDLAALYIDGGWELVALEEYLGGGGDGVPIPWAAVTVRRPAEPA